MSNEKMTTAEYHQMWRKPKRPTIADAVAHKLTAQGGASAKPTAGTGALFYVTLAVPPSLNNAYKNVKRGRVLTKEAKEYKDAAKEAVTRAAQFHKFACPSDARFALSLRLYFSSNHRRDVSNCAKLPEDALSEVLGFDDCRVDRLVVERGEIDKQNPRCEITLEVL